MVRVLTIIIITRHFLSLKIARTKQANRSTAPRATNLPMARFNDDDDDAADKNQQGINLPR